MSETQNDNSSAAMSPWLALFKRAAIEVLRDFFTERPRLLPIEPKYVRPDAAAKRGPFDVQTLAQRRCAGLSPPYRKVGGRVYYAIVDLDAEIEKEPLQGGGAIEGDQVNDNTPPHRQRQARGE